MAMPIYLHQSGRSAVVWTTWPLRRKWETILAFQKFATKAEPEKKVFAAWVFGSGHGCVARPQAFGKGFMAKD